MSSLRSASDGTRTVPTSSDASSRGRRPDSTEVGAEVLAITRTSGAAALLRRPGAARGLEPLGEPAPGAPAAAGGSPRGRACRSRPAPGGTGSATAAAAGVPLARPREKPLRVAGSEQRAVDVDERLPAPRRLVVDRARDRLVPRSRGPRQEQRLERERALGDRLPQGAHGRARPDERALDPAARVGQHLLRDLQLAGELGVAALELGLEPLDGEVRVDPRDHLLRLEGLGDEVHGPRLEPAHLLPRLRERGEEDDRGAPRLRVGLQPAARLVAVDAGHDHVEEDDRGSGAVRDLERVLAARGDEQAVAAPVERLPQEVEVRRLVVHEEDARRLVGPGGARVGVASRHVGSILDGRGPRVRAAPRSTEHAADAKPGPCDRHRRRRARGRRRDRRGRLDGEPAVAPRGSRTSCAPTCGGWRRSLGLWAADQVGGVKAVASEPRVRAAVAAVVAGRPAEVESWVRPASAVRGYLGFFITDAEWRVVASDEPELVGQPAHFASDPAFTGRLRTEGAAITRPLPSAHAAPRRQGRRARGRADAVRVRLGEPAGSPGGALCFRLDPLRTFNVVLSGRSDRGDGRGVRDRPRGAAAVAEPLRGGAGRDGASSRRAPRRSSPSRPACPRSASSHGRVLLSVSPTAPLTPMAQAAVDEPRADRAPRRATWTTAGSPWSAPRSGCPRSTSASSSSRTRTRPGPRSATPVARSSPSGARRSPSSPPRGSSSPAPAARPRRASAGSARSSTTPRRRWRSRTATAPTSWRTRPGCACCSGPESQVLGRRDEDVLPFDAASRRQALERQVLERRPPGGGHRGLDGRGRGPALPDRGLPRARRGERDHRPRRHLDRRHDAGAERAAALRSSRATSSAWSRSAPPSSRSRRSGAASSSAR